MIRGHTVWVRHSSVNVCREFMLPAPWFHGLNLAGEVFHHAVVLTDAARLSGLLIFRELVRLAQHMRSALERVHGVAATETDLVEDGLHGFVTVCDAPRKLWVFFLAIG